MQRLIALIFIHLALSGMPALAETAVPESVGQMQLSFAPVVKTTAPAVVNVYSKTRSFANSSVIEEISGGRGGRRRTHLALALSLMRPD
jgi:S1-C subfamily serine protease